MTTEPEKMAHAMALASARANVAMARFMVVFLKHPKVGSANARAEAPRTLEEAERRLAELEQKA